MFLRPLFQLFSSNDFSIFSLTLSAKSNKKVFKVPLEDHLAVTNRSISYVIELCVCCLLEKGLFEEGLLRVGCGKFKFFLFAWLCRPLFERLQAKSEHSLYYTAGYVLFPPAVVHLIHTNLEVSR